MLSLRREAEERATWAQLAQDSETAGLAIAARLDALQATAEAAPKADIFGLVQRGEEAATKIDLDEASTRDLIDQQLRDRQWEANTKTMRHSAGVRPVKGRNMANCRMAHSERTSRLRIVRGYSPYRGRRGETTP